MLVSKIIPLLAGPILRGAVIPVGSEDREELIADGTALAARILDSAESRGRTVPSSSVAFYVIQALRGGRRSTSASRTDALAPATQLDGRARVRYLDDIVYPDDEQEGALHLEDCLASSSEDTANAAGRHLDWDSALGLLDSRQESILVGTAAGVAVDELAKKHGVSAPRIVQIRRQAGTRIRECWGETGNAHVVGESAWKRGMRALSESRAGRAERAAR